MKLTWLTNIFQQRILTGTHTQSVVQVPPSECARKRKCKTRSSMIILMTILLLVYEGFSVELGNNNSKVSTIYLLSSSSVHCIGVHTHSASVLLSTHEMRWDQLRGGVGGEVAGTMTDGWTGQDELTNLKIPIGHTRLSLFPTVTTRCATPPKLSHSSKPLE